MDKNSKDLVTKKSLLNKFNLESNCNFRTAVNLILSEYKSYSFKNNDVEDIIKTVHELLITSDGTGSKDDDNLIIASYILNTLEIDE